MDYGKLTTDITAGFETDYTFELTKFCLGEFPMFKTFITDDFSNYTNY